MEELTRELRSAFESEGYDVAEVSANRDRVRVAVLDEEASAGELQSITYGVVDEDDALGLNVSTESAEGQGGVTTVVSFQYRG